MRKWSLITRMLCMFLVYIHFWFYIFFSFHYVMYFRFKFPSLCLSNILNMHFLFKVIGWVFQLGGDIIFFFYNLLILYRVPINLNFLSLSCCFQSWLLFRCILAFLKCFFSFPIFKRFIRSSQFVTLSLFLWRFRYSQAYFVLPVFIAITSFLLIACGVWGFHLLSNYLVPQ